MKRACGDNCVITVETRMGVDVFECSPDEAEFVFDFLSFMAHSMNFKGEEE